MKKVGVFLVICLLLAMPIAVAQEVGFWKNIFNKITGRVSGGSGNKSDGEMMGGPSSEQQACMKNCFLVENRSEDICMQECSMEPKPEPANEGEACMQKCVAQGCGEHDFQCELKNKEKCEDNCGMKGDAPDESEMSEEQRCISNCVAKVDASIRCGGSQEGETGGEVCQRCANECLHLYEGPCLNDEQLTEKEKECETCEHCYGEPVMGQSGEGWDCVVDIECKDASNEFGDEPGEGPGIIESVGDVVGNVFKGIGNFFRGLFGGGGDEEVVEDRGRVGGEEEIGSGAVKESGLEE